MYNIGVPCWRPSRHPMRAWEQRSSSSKSLEFYSISLGVKGLPMSASQTFISLLLLISKEKGGKTGRRKKEGEKKERSRCRSP